MEAIGLPIYDKLRQFKQLPQKVLDEHGLLFEAPIHLVEDGHCFCEGEINPSELS